jgi:hypothetical protein
MLARMIWLKIDSTVSSHRDDETDYMVSVNVDVFAHSEFTDDQYIVGKLSIDRCLWADAENEGFSLLEVCDCDSEGWLQVHQILTERGTDSELRSDLELTAYYTDVFFVYQILFHPDIKDRIAIMDAAIRAVTTMDSVVVMWRDAPQNTPLSDKEFAELGFRKVAGEHLVFRDNHLRNPFDDDYPRGREVEFEGTTEHEDWVTSKWDRRQSATE